MAKYEHISLNYHTIPAPSVSLSNACTYVFDKIEQKRDATSNIVELVHLYILDQLNSKGVVILALAARWYLNKQNNSLSRFSWQLHHWAASWQDQHNDLCAQRRLRSAWALAHSDLSLRCPDEETLGLQLPIERIAKTLIRPGWSESSLGAQIILLVLSWGGSVFFHISTAC